MFSYIQIRDYIDNRGEICPYCGESSVTISVDIELEIINQDRLVQRMKCKSCKKTWNEIYPMFNIEEINIDEQIDDK